MHFFHVFFLFFSWLTGRRLTVVWKVKEFRMVNGHIRIAFVQLSDKIVSFFVTFPREPLRNIKLSYSFPWWYRLIVFPSTSSNFWLFDRDFLIFCPLINNNEVGPFLMLWEHISSVSGWLIWSRHYVLWKQIRTSDHDISTYNNTWQHIKKTLMLLSEKKRWNFMQLNIKTLKLSVIQLKTSMCSSVSSVNDSFQIYFTWFWFLLYLELLLAFARFWRFALRPMRLMASFTSGQNFCLRQSRTAFLISSVLSTSRDVLYASRIWLLRTIELSTLFP